MNRSRRWRSALEEPFSLFSYVFGHLSQQLDSMACRLSTVFSNMEHVRNIPLISYFFQSLNQKQTILTQAEHPESAAQNVDFVEMHNVAKTIIYLNEGADAMISSVGSMLESHQMDAHDQQSASAAMTIHGLRYQKGVFHSTQLRLQSLEKRMNNILNLVRFSFSPIGF